MYTVYYYIAIGLLLHTTHTKLDVTCHRTTDAHARATMKNAFYVRDI